MARLTAPARVSLVALHAMAMLVLSACTAQYPLNPGVAKIDRA